MTRVKLILEHSTLHCWRRFGHSKQQQEQQEQHEPVPVANPRIC